MLPYLFDWCGWGSMLLLCSMHCQAAVPERPDRCMHGAGSGMRAARCHGVSNADGHMVWWYHLRSSAETPLVQVAMCSFRNACGQHHRVDCKAPSSGL